MTTPQIDIARCLDGMMNINVVGSPSSPEREKVIEEAIGAIQLDGAKALKERYLGIKNYAQFGDQRADCEYGCGPRHGSIVFSVGRASRNCETVLGANEIYLLECVRDFGTRAVDRQAVGLSLDHYNSKASLNLCDILVLIEKYQLHIETLKSLLS